MSGKLYNILVPVSFGSRDKWAIAKAIELSNHFNCRIHLVYFSGRAQRLFRRNERFESAALRLRGLRDRYANQLCGEGTMEVAGMAGKRRRQMQHYIRHHEIDLVIIGLSRFNLLHRLISSISIPRLSAQLQCPVLAVRASGLLYHFKKIVLPVTNDLPIRQIRLAALLGRAFRSTVYFVSLRRQPETKGQAIVSQALELLQSISTIPVQCFLLEGKNIAQSTLEFSKKINADLILIHPLKEFRLPGFWNRLTNNLLSYRSKIPVAIVSPDN